MSWDVVLIKTETNEEPLDERMDPMAIDSGLFVDAVRRLEPDAYIFPDEVIITRPEYSVEVLGLDKPPHTTITLFVRGQRAPMELIGGLCAELDCRAIDSGTGDFIDFSVGSPGFAAWKEYRDHVVAKGAAQQQ